MPIPIAGLEKLAGDMLSVYAQAEEKMISIMAKQLGKDTDYSRWTSIKYSEIVQVNRQLTKVVNDLKSTRTTLTKSAIEEAWSSATESFVADEKAFTKAIDIYPLSVNSPKVASILNEVNGLLDKEDRIILRQANDVYTDVISRSAALVATGTYTLRQAVQSALDDFAEKGITGFIDKNGGHWDMATYAEMATLTAIQRATLYGYVDTMKEYGHDLAIISSHAGACPLCEAWEDVIISVSGDNKDYPSLDDAISDGCFHPRCVHYISTYYDGVTKGGRNAPSEVKEPNKEYTGNQKQRYYERQIRSWKRRQAASTSPQAERLAYAHVRRFQQAARDNIKNFDSKYGELSRKYYREGGRQVLSPEARRLRPVVLNR